MKANYETLLDALTNEMQALHKELQECKEKLSQGACGDTISRQAVLDINEHYHGKMPSHVNHEIWKEINALQPVTPMQKWIPVSEGLPEDNTLVLVTVKVGNREPKVRSGYYYMNGHFHIDNGDCWEARDKELIAWMPLPEPYKPEVEE